ncbi:MAG: winged helix-turn-helix transcriptional regulator [Flavobacteriales bacterium]|nr:winged helix-turn-helix transcriptional regulator [Flavobacteriales bacterium]
MGISKAHHFSENQNAIASIAKALGHPARVAIIELLLKSQTCICGDIVNELPLAQATISQHLKELKAAGLIQGTIEGNAICYCLNPKAITLLKNYIENIITHLNQRKENCC